MATTFTNNWKNILDKLVSLFRAEFKGAMPIVIGSKDQSAGNQFIRVVPESTDLVEQNVSSELREYSITLEYIFNDANIRKASLDHITRIIARVESLVQDNVSMTLSDSTSAFNCKVDSTNIDSEDEGGYIVTFDFTFLYLVNVS